MTAASVAGQVARVRAELERQPKGLVAHVERVLEEAIDLGKRWDLDPERIELAVWGHDLFRAHPPAEQLRLAREAGLDPSDEEAAYPVLLHGPIAAVVLRERFAVTDDDALAAVRDHTAGLAQMSSIAKVLLIADKVEPRKRNRAPIMKEIRRLARRDLDTALLCWADWKWVDERRHGYGSYAAHWRARAGWLGDHHEEIGLPVRTPDDAPDLDAEFRLIAAVEEPAPEHLAE